MRVRDEFELMASRSTPVGGEQGDALPSSSLPMDAEDVAAKAKELSLNLKSINQLYNDYALPYKLWEVISHLFIWNSIAYCKAQNYMYNPANLRNLYICPFEASSTRTFKLYNLFLSPSLCAEEHLAAKVVL